VNPLETTTTVIVCAAVGLIGGVLINIGLKGLKR
jgi:hypothetical protein